MKFIFFYIIRQLKQLPYQTTVPVNVLEGLRVMSVVRVEKIIVKEFKRISNIEIELKPITALVGGNTSGKSSVLQAAQIYVSTLQASYKGTKRGGKPDYYTTLSNEAVSYRPTDSLLDHLKIGGEIVTST
jgi:hypothetical protein